MAKNFTSFARYLQFKWNMKCNAVVCRKTHKEMKRLYVKLGSEGRNTKYSLQING